MSWIAEGKDGLRIEVPDDMSPDDPRLRSMFNQRRGQEEAKGTGALGAMGKLAYGGAENIVQGVGQVLGVGPDENAVEQKRAKMEALKEKTNLHILPEWMPTLGSGAEFVGEMLPTALIPVGGEMAMASRLAARTPMLAKTLGAAFSTPARQAVTMGAAQGAAQPLMNDESRVARTIGGGVVGGATAKAIPAALGAWRFATDKGRAENAILSSLEREAAAKGEDAGQYVEKIKSRLAPEEEYLRADPRLLESAGARSESPILAEKFVKAGETEAARPQMTDFLTRQKGAQADVVADALKAAGTVEEAKLAREAATTPLMNQTYADINETNLGMMAQAHFGDILPKLEAQYGTVPEVQTVLRQVRDTIKSFLPPKEGMPPPEIENPAMKMHALRRQLTDALYTPNELNKTPLQQSAENQIARPIIQDLVKNLDEVMGTAAKIGSREGKDTWAEYLKRYGESSSQVEAARAARTAGEILGPDYKRPFGGKPEIKLGPLQQALKADVRNRFAPGESAYAAETSQGMREAARNIMREEDILKQSTAAGARGGETAEQSTDRTIRDFAKGMTRPFWRSAAEALSAGQNKELVRMLSNPEAALTAIQMAQKARRPLSPAMEEFMKYWGVVNAHWATQGKNRR